MNAGEQLPQLRHRQLLDLFGELDEHLLNGSAAIFAPNMDAAATVVYRGERLVVRAAGPHYLLAMKLRAARPEDLHDAVQLAIEIGRTTRESLFDLIHDGYWRGTRIANLEAFVTQVLHEISENLPDEAPDSQPRPGLDI